MSVVQRDIYKMLSIGIINHKIDGPTTRFKITCPIWEGLEFKFARVDGGDDI